MRWRIMDHHAAAREVLVAPEAEAPVTCVAAVKVDQTDVGKLVLADAVPADKAKVVLAGRVLAGRVLADVGRMAGDQVLTNGAGPVASGRPEDLASSLEVRGEEVRAVPAADRGTEVLIWIRWSGLIRIACRSEVDCWPYRN